jgi:hypothetical protein
MELPQLLARLDVKKRKDEENGGERQHEQILHCKSPKRLTVPCGTMPAERIRASARNLFCLSVDCGHERIF